MAANAKPLILYDNRFEDADPTATDTETDYNVLNLIDWRDYTFWQADSAGTKYIKVDCGAAATADTLAIAGHNFYTASANLSLASSTDDSCWTERVPEFTVDTDDVLMKTFTLVSVRYWRLKIVTAAVAAKMAILAVGQRLDFERYPYGDFDPDHEEIVADTEVSKAGYLLGTTIRHYPRSIGLQFKNLTPTWCKNSFYPAWVDHLSLMKPFFFAWEITNHPLEVYLVRLKDGSKLAMPYNPVRRSLNLDFVGIRE